MKKTLPLLLLITLGLFSSCEKENYDSFESASLKAQNQMQSNYLGGNQNCNYENDLFERQLHWMSAITSKILRFHPAARTEVQVALSNNVANTIPAEDLIGGNSTMSAFHTAFEQEFYYYLNPPDPDSDNTRPQIPPASGGAPGPSGIFAIYLDNILIDNCVELYFPTGLNLNGSFTSTATAHPLTEEDCNEGIKRLYYQPNGSSGPGDPAEGGSYTSPVTVNDLYNNANDNVIVARPVRDNGSPSSNCTYTQYNVTDFEDFLD